MQSLATTTGHRRWTTWRKWSILKCALKKRYGKSCSFNFYCIIKIPSINTCRLYPAVPIIARRLGEDVKCGKTVLPAGCEIFVIPYATHRLEHVYPEPEKFLPERFSSENCEKRNPYAFLPFSAGPRNCIGHKFAILEMKTVISTIIRSYRLLPVAGKTTFQPLFRITLRARGGLWVRFEPRNNNNLASSNNYGALKVEWKSLLKVLMNSML